MARQLKIPGSHLFLLSQRYLAVKWNYWLALTVTRQLPKKKQQTKQTKTKTKTWRGATLFSIQVWLRAGPLGWFHDIIPWRLFCFKPAWWVIQNSEGVGTVELVSNTLKKKKDCGQKLTWGGILMNYLLALYIYSLPLNFIQINVQMLLL